MNHARTSFLTTSTLAIVLLGCVGPAASAATCAAGGCAELWQLCVANGIPIDGYAGFRALSADYSQGPGTSRFVYDNTMYGPVLGATMRF